MIGEGFDDARLDTLQQYTGRTHRSGLGKTEVRVHDYVVRRIAVLDRMFKRRLAGYRSFGYEQVGKSER